MPRKATVSPRWRWIISMNDSPTPTETANRTRRPRHHARRPHPRHPSSPHSGRSAARSIRGRSSQGSTRADGGWRCPAWLRTSQTHPSQRTVATMRFLEVPAHRLDEAASLFAAKPIRSHSADEPWMAAFPAVPVPDIDAFAVPLVAYDDDGNRLGYGGGNYDRVLPLASPGCDGCRRRLCRTTRGRRYPRRHTTCVFPSYQPESSIATPTATVPEKQLDTAETATHKPVHHPIQYGIPARYRRNTTNRHAEYRDACILGWCCPGKLSG